MKKCECPALARRAVQNSDANPTSHVIEYKSFYESPHRIAKLEEARGKLIKIFEAEGQCVAAFEWGAISLPLEMRDELTALVGREIACLKLDGKIHTRVVDID